MANNWYDRDDYDQPDESRGMRRDFDQRRDDRYHGYGARYNRDMGQAFNRAFDSDYIRDDRDFERQDLNRDFIQDYGRSHDRDFNRGYNYGSTIDDYRSSRDESRYGRDRYGRSSTFGSSYSPRYGTQNYRDQDYGNMGSRMSYAGRGPKGWKRSDERIQEDVSDILARDHRIDASDIEVSVKDGIVTLRGSVDERRTKRLAEDVIENCSGVIDVRNELSVNQSFFQQAKEILTGESNKSEKQQRSTATKH